MREVVDRRRDGLAGGHVGDLAGDPDAALEAMSNLTGSNPGLRRCFDSPGAEVRPIDRRIDRQLVPACAFLGQARSAGNGLARRSRSRSTRRSSASSPRAPPRSRSRPGSAGSYRRRGRSPRSVASARRRSCRWRRGSPRSSRPWKAGSRGCSLMRSIARVSTLTCLSAIVGPESVRLAMHVAAQARDPEPAVRVGHDAVRQEPVSVQDQSPHHRDRVARCGLRAGRRPHFRHRLARLFR